MAKAKQQPGAKVPGFIVNSPLLHNSDAYAVGEAVELSEAEAGPLLLTGTVTRVAPIKEAAPSENGTGEVSTTGTPAQ